MPNLKDLRSIKWTRPRIVAVAVFFVLLSIPLWLANRDGRVKAAETPQADSVAESGSTSSDSTAPEDASLSRAEKDSLLALGVRDTDAVASQADSASASAPASPQDTADADSAESASAPAAATATAQATKYRSGEDPEFAARMGWPVDSPAPVAGALLPFKRIVAYYGNPLSKRMGVLGEYPKEEMLRRFDAAVEQWRKADPSTPVQPALHLIAVVAQGDAGPSGKYRTIMRDTMIEMVYNWAKSRNAILFIDIQTGQSDIRELLPKFEKFLIRPDVHLAIDPEFMMVKSGAKPGTKIGTMDAADINYASGYLAELVRKHNLPAKVLVIHRFTRNMLTNAEQVKLRPEVQVVVNMDGWGAPWLKRDSYKDYVVRHPVQYTGFKLFYHNDTKKGDPLMSPADVLKLRPQPIYIQYQ